MSQEFFSIYTFTPWDKLSADKLSEVRLLSLKSVFNSFPVIEPDFFEDIYSKVGKFDNYSTFKTIKRVTGPQNEDYDIRNWQFIWATDDNDRMYQFLFQKRKTDKGIQGILVALAPPELATFFSDYKKDAILKTFSLLTIPKKIKFLTLLQNKGKSLSQDLKSFQYNPADLQKIKYANMLKQTPNIKGQWFPTFKPTCPICNEQLVDLGGYEVGFGQMICPRCGYKKIK